MGPIVSDIQYVRHLTLLLVLTTTIMKDKTYRNIVLILDGNSEHVAHAWRKIGIFGKKNMICDGSRSKQMPYTDQITKIAPYARTYF